MPLSADQILGIDQVCSLRDHVCGFRKIATPSPPEDSESENNSFNNEAETCYDVRPVMVRIVVRVCRAKMSISKPLLLRQIFSFTTARRFLAITEDL